MGEIDRTVHWTAVCFEPMAAPWQYIAFAPLSEMPEYSSMFLGIPSAKDLYDTVNDDWILSLDPFFPI